MIKESLIKIELDWIEDKVNKMMKALENIQIDDLEDRKMVTISPKGLPMDKVVATIEQQQSSFIKLMREIMDMLPQLKKLREENQTAEIEMKGGASLNSLMKRKIAKISDV